MVRPRAVTGPAGDLGVSVASMRQDWRAAAQCRIEQADPRLFDHRGDDDAKIGLPPRVFLAVSYCERCPVTAECAADRGADRGVWGGVWHDGQPPLQPTTPQPVVVPAKPAKAPALVKRELSPRQLEMLALAAAGLSLGKIAHRMGLSKGCAWGYHTRVLRKLDARDLPHAVEIAADRGLIPAVARG